MYGMIPWFDEVHIVEMGRLLLAGGDVDSILMGKSDVVLAPIYYLGPCLQELAFRIGGVAGVRTMPFLGLPLVWWGFRLWLKRSSSIPWLPRELLALSLLFSPLLFQSAILTRVDIWALACVFGSLAAIGEGGLPSLALGAFLAVCSVFVWPTSAVLAFIYPAFAFSWERRREFLWFCLFAAVSALVLLIPFMPRLPLMLAAFNRHYTEAATPARSLVSIVEPLAREFARSPLLFGLSVIGFFHAVWMRRWAKVAACLLALGVAAAAGGLYTFRIIYLLPPFLLLGAEFLEDVVRRKPRLVTSFLSLCVAYGVLTGPVGHCFLSCPTLPDNLEEQLAEVVGTGPVRVFAPDHFSYYIGRNLGWRQVGCADPSEPNNPAVLAKLLSGCDAAVLRDVDSFTPFQQSCTPYGLFCQYVFRAARRESEFPLEQRSWAAKFGSKYSFAWHGPLMLDGFEEVRRIGFVRVYRRRRQNPSP